MANTKFVDRLRERGFIDQWGFLLFALVGTVGIIGAKALGIDYRLVTVCAVGSMILYALIVVRVGTGRLRADQAGDNCYYLGLLYTLGSLAYAIWTFDPSRTATAVVQSFGIALFTTIFGLMLRVYFNQGRPDLENVEEQTRIEFADATSRLKSQLNSAILEISDFHTRVRQSMEEVQEAATKSLEEFAKTTTAGLQTVVDTANETIREEASSFNTRSKRFSTTFDTLLVKLEKRGEGLTQVALAQDALMESANAAKQMADGALATVNAIANAAAGAEASAQAASRTADSARETSDRLAGLVEDLQAGLASLRSETDQQLAALKDGPAKAASEAIRSLHEASDALAGHVVAISELHERTQSGLASQTQAALDASKHNNDLLLAELARSQALVSQVHTALADMTESLAKSVEASA